MKKIISCISPSFLIFFLVFSPAFPCFAIDDPNCSFIINDPAVQELIAQKETAFNSIQFNKIIQNIIPDEEKPCTIALYEKAKSDDNIWYKFYCSIIASEKGYNDYAKSLQLKLLYDPDIPSFNHTLMALEYARRNNRLLMEKHFSRAIKKMSECDHIQELILLTDNIYLVEQLTDYYPSKTASPLSANTNTLATFYRLAYWLIKNFSNFNARSVIMSFTTELLLRNAEYQQARDFKDFSLNQALSQGVN